MAERNKSSSRDNPQTEHTVLHDPGRSVRPGYSSPEPLAVTLDGPPKGVNRPETQPAVADEDSGANGADMMQNEAPDANKDASTTFDDHDAALALCADGEIRHANRSFVFAFGYDSAEELIDAGGLRRLFPTEPRFLFKPEESDDGRVDDVDATTRSRRRIRIPVALHRVAATDGLPAWMMVIRPGDMSYAPDELPLPSPDASPSPPAAEHEVSDTTADNQPVAQAPDSTDERKQDNAVEPNEAADVEETDTVVDIGTQSPSNDMATLEPVPEPVPQSETAPTPSRGEHREADFLAKVSHDVRTPLNTIIGFAQLMKEERFGPVGNDRYRSYIKDILASGQHALGMINDLLDISSIEAGAFKLNFTSVDLRDLIADCTRSMHRQAQAKRVLLRCSLPHRLPLVLADARSMNQVLLTLLANAIDVTRPGGQVIVDVRLKRSGALRLRVQDAGPGMSKSEIDQAMEPFEPHETAPRQQVGTGLGLPLTRALVQANRAGFKLRSSAKSGTRVTLTFPAERTVQP